MEIIIFPDDLSKSNNFTGEGYGKINRVYYLRRGRRIAGMPKKFLQWMIDNYSVKHVIKIKGADLMGLLSKPQNFVIAS
ncbi:hypothetical protein Dsin_010020 [Dipteronia sinensis]|uniref:Uncharacterized protein n=1 Tax=Dipteronia sinensis TaxID=43782 RepID=A0AAE0ASE9_9ROSI|nr:hypothetical protein Dsin_010020 [Dipteronia sinensis]